MLHKTCPRFAGIDPRPPSSRPLIRSTFSSRLCFMEPSATMTALDRMLDPLSDCLNVEAAQRIVALRIDLGIETRIAELADRSNEGLLTEEERAEYDSYVPVQPSPGSLG
jgi:hypothetical protein